MLKKFIFVIAILFAFVLMAQNSPTMKEQATGIKNTIVEIDTLKSSGKTGTTGTSGIIKKVEKKLIMTDEAIEKEIKRRVKEEVAKITEKEIQKRVEVELKKRMKKEEPKIVKKKVEKKVYISSFKETQYAEELYLSGDKTKAKSFLSVLKDDKNKKLAEEAHFLMIKWFSDIYIPVMQRSENYNKVLSYDNNLKECDNFKKAYPKSKYLKELNKTMKKKVTTFNSINKMNNFNLVDLKDSCVIEFKGDSTYVCRFEKSFKDKNNKRHNVIIRISGKITKYDPSGDMQDEWDTSGLLINDDSLIEIVLDGNRIIGYDHPILHKQNPEYELRKVVEYGFSQNKTCVKEHEVSNILNIASYLTDNLIVSNLEIKTHFGRMDELASMDIIYAAKPNGNFFSDRFKSKCYVELTLNEAD